MTKSKQETTGIFSRLKERAILLWRVVKTFFRDVYGWCRSVVILYFTGTDRIRVFYGFSHWGWSQKYADKRMRLYKASMDQLGRDQCVQPYEEDSLIVLSKLELKYLQKGDRTHNLRNYKKIFKKGSYYKTD